jgi:tetratricopeptide (TPR) repeat protein
MRTRRRLAVILMALAVICLSSIAASAQTDEFGDSAADPVRLFERGQGAHARGELEKALEYYEQAIKVRPEFPEAEFQRGNALTSLGRFDEAERAFRQAINLKKNWSLPYSALGTLLMRGSRDTEAESTFRQALAADAQDNVALRMLVEIRLRAGDAKEALELAKRATASSEAPSSAWVGLAAAERAAGNKTAAKTVLDRLITEDDKNLPALLERADLLIDDRDFDGAARDLKQAIAIKPNDKVILSRLAFVYQQSGKASEALEVANAAGLQIKTNKGNGPGGVIGTPEEIEAANSTDVSVARPALDKLLEINPRNAMLLGRLGATYRTIDPAKALEYYRRAAEIQPDVSEHASGYAAALVQAKRFPEAAHILRQVVKVQPENYAAHANLATALYESKRYPEAIAEFEWVLAKKPEVAVAHYFIATAHDYLGEFPEALESYQKFLSNADAKTNKLEIDKVNLRLPTLRRQIQLGEGVKKKKPE